MLMALLVPHQSGAPPETGRAVRLRQTAPASRRDSPPPRLQPGGGERSERTGLTGAAARPGPRRTSWSPSGSGSPEGTWEKNPQDNVIRFSPGGRGVTPRRWGTHSLFSFSRAEKGPFMSSMVQEISFFWRSLWTDAETPRCWTDPADVTFIKLYVALHSV